MVICTMIYEIILFLQRMTGSKGDFFFRPEDYRITFRLKMKISKRKYFDQRHVQSSISELLMGLLCFPYPGTWRYEAGLVKCLLEGSIVHSSGL